MDKWLKVSLAAAVLLAGGGASWYLKDGTSRAPDGVNVAQHSALQHCLQAAQMIYDVHWAAACTTQGSANDHADCDLPDAKAAVVNAWLDRAEARCRADARAGPDP